MRCLAWLIAGGLIWAAGGEARAERAALASADAELEKALRAALAPTRIEVTTISDEAPPRTGDVLAFARAVSARDGAAAVVWVAAGADGTSTLLVYDRDVDRVLQRPLEWASPFGVEQAIAAARTVRTMLRALRVTPDLDQPPPSAAEAPRVREETARRLAEPRPAVAPPAVRPSALGVESGAGVRLGGAGASAWRVVGGLSWRLGPAALAAALAFVASEPVSDAGFEGSYRDTTAAVLARLPLAAGPLVVEPAAGVAAHFARLAGTLEMASVGERRIDPALRAGCFLGVRAVGPVQVGLMVSGDLLLRRQRYLAGDAEVLDLPVFEGGLDLSVRLAGM